MAEPPRIERYEVVRELGRGRLGRVLEVRDPTTDRVLALKLLDSRLADTEDLLRFQREAEVMARVRSAHVVRVHEVGQSTAGPFFVSELVEGRPLDKLAAAGPLPAHEVARLGRGIADGLAACHAVGIVHRDLKPANVVVRPDGSPVIIDFGVARDQQARSMTEVGALLGTPAYMAPEQVNGDEVDHRADLYGLGATLFACLAGRPPFETTGAMTGLLTKVLLEEPSWPTSRAASIPPGLEGIIRRAMAKAPADRFSDAVELRDALDRWLASGAGPAAPPTRAPPPRGVLRALAGLLGLALVAGAVLVGVVLRGEPPPTPGPRPTTTTTRPPTTQAPPPTTEPARPTATEAPRPGQLVRRLTLPAADPEGDRRDARAAYLDDGSIVAGLSDGSVLRWATVEAPAARLALDPTHAFTTITSLGDGGVLLGTRAGALVRVGQGSVSTLGGLPEPVPGSSYVWSLAHDPGSGRVAVGLGAPPTLDRDAPAGGSVYLGRLGPAGLLDVTRVGGIDQPAQGLAFSDDGGWLGVAWGMGLSRARGVVTVRLADGRVRPFDWSSATPRGAVFLPGTHRFAVGSTDGVIRAADLEADLSGFEVLVAEPGESMLRKAHDDAVLVLAARGRRLASSSWELGATRGKGVGTVGDVRVWDLAHPDGRELLLPRAGARHLCFSPRGDRLLVSGDLGLVEVWALGPAP